MCPSKQILSAYIDEELPPRFELEVMDHVSRCKACSETIRKFKEINQTVTADNLTRMMSESQPVVWRNIQNQIMVRKHTPVFLRSIRVPMPVLAAVAVLVIAGLFSLTLSPLQEHTISNEVSISELPTFDNMDELLVFLESQQKNRTIKMEIPEEPVLFLKSKPTLIHEADFR